MDPALFYVDAGEVSAEVRETCEACPVAGECLNEALSRVELGYWGGKSSRERRVLRRELGRGNVNGGRKPATCGTAAGYRRHVRLNERRCAACLEANRKATARYQGRAA
jgi:hypothetical protein